MEKENNQNMSPLPQKVVESIREFTSTQNFTLLPQKVVEQKEEITNNQTSTLSPQKVIRIQEETTMDFPEAMRAVIDGKKITKLEWGTKAIYGQLDEEILKLRKEDGKFYQWIISEGDMQGLDYIAI